MDGKNELTEKDSEEMCVWGERVRHGIKIQITT